jgi:hypothetical protein
MRSYQWLRGASLAISNGAYWFVMGKGGPWNAGGALVNPGDLAGP